MEIVRAVIGHSAAASTTFPDEDRVSLKDLPADLQTALHKYDDGTGYLSDDVVLSALSGFVNVQKGKIPLAAFEPKLAMELKVLDEDNDGFLDANEIEKGVFRIVKQRNRLREMGWMVCMLFVFMLVLLAAVFGLVYWVVDLQKDVKAQNGYLVNRADGTPLKVASADVVIRNGGLYAESSSFDTSVLRQSNGSNNVPLPPPQGPVQTVQQTYGFDQLTSNWGNSVFMNLKDLTLMPPTDGERDSFMHVTIDAVARLPPTPGTTPSFFGSHDGSVILLMTSAGRFVLNGSDVRAASGELLTADLPALFNMVLGESASSPSVQVTAKAKAFSCPVGSFCVGAVTFACSNHLYLNATGEQMTNCMGHYMVRFDGATELPYFSHVSEDCVVFYLGLDTNQWVLRTGTQPVSGAAFTAQGGDSYSLDLKTFKGADGTTDFDGSPTATPPPASTAAAGAVAVGAAVNTQLYCPGSDRSAEGFYLAPPFTRACAVGSYCPVTRTQVPCRDLTVYPLAATPAVTPPVSPGVVHGLYKLTPTALVAGLPAYVREDGSYFIARDASVADVGGAGAWGLWAGGLLEAATTVGGLSSPLFRGGVDGDVRKDWSALQVSADPRPNADVACPAGSAAAKPAAAAAA